MANVKKNDVVFQVRGIDVHFPFQPYEVQKIYMERVIEALQRVMKQFELMIELIFVQFRMKKLSLFFCLHFVRKSWKSIGFKIFFFVSP